MRISESIADSINKDIERAEKKLKAAQTKLIESLQKGYRFATEDTDELAREEALVDLWAGIGRALKRETEETGDAEQAARKAITKGRERCLEIVLSGPTHSTSLSRRAKSEIEVEAARYLHYNLAGYED
ncbi:hypothetical protein ABZT26_36160 [Streptomyces sp. NPDC005395]|uniref:hypothetical protein n=1 Tax=Streptomyces sp. NPDC005395 TaxID=3157042 RepID=UPI0033AE127F